MFIRDRTGCVSVTSSYCETHHDQQTVGEERAYFISPLRVHQTGKSGQELKAGTEAEATDDGVLLTVLLLMACSACFLTTSRSTRLGRAVFIVGWVLL